MECQYRKKRQIRVLWITYTKWLRSPEHNNRGKTLCFILTLELCLWHWHQYSTTCTPVIVYDTATNNTSNILSRSARTSEAASWDWTSTAARTPFIITQCVFVCLEADRDLHHTAKSARVPENKLWLLNVRGCLLEVLQKCVREENTHTFKLNDNQLVGLIYREHNILYCLQPQGKDRTKDIQRAKRRAKTHTSYPCWCAY